MIELSKYIDKNSLHHAYLIEGKADEIVPDLFKFFDAIGIQTTANPDFWHRTFDTFKIDDARELKESQIQKAVSGNLPAGEAGKKIFVIVTEFFTSEAQNALLKILEEPAPGVHFFIITSRPDHLFKTLLSRLSVIQPKKNKAKDERIKDVKSFIKSEKEDRLEFVKMLVKKYEKEETSMPLKIEALSFLNDLEYCLREKKRIGVDRDKSGLNSSSPPACAEASAGRQDYKCFEEIWKCRNYIGARGSSVKMLLEHLALVLDRNIK